jgi:hypothetical protein
VADRKTPPLIDLAAVAVSPALIMLMVGSLVFFLIEVLYGGQWTDRLIYTFFFFVFGIVLIARLHIREGGGKARLYGGGLGIVTFIAMLQFVEYPVAWLKTFGPVINLGLMALVWWVSHKLTWDCTHLDEGRTASGRGVLAAAGLDSTPSTTTAEDDEAFDPDPDRASQAVKAKKKKAPPLTWLQRYEKYREWKRKKPHTPGVWVLYFAVAALPLFALGQALIPADDTARRAATFWQMATYIGSALGLLVTTSLLGLRRYLEDRNARIPTGITVGWLGMGAAVILVFLAVGAVLPRPHSETPLYSWDRGGKSDRNASKNAQVRDNSAGKGEGAEGKKTEAGKGKANGKNGEPGGGNKGEKGSGNGDKGNNSGGKQKGDSGGQKGKEGNDKAANPNEPNAKGQDGEKGKDEQDDRQSGGPDRDADEKADDDSGKSDQAARLKNLGEAGEKIAKLVKWLLWTAIVILVVAALLYYGLSWMAPFTNWAQGLLDWLRGLFGKKPTGKKRKARVEEEALAGELRPPPFHAFTNPFDDGTARHRHPAELLAYSFAAFDSWAWDRDRGRTEDETPTEFAARIAEDFPDLTEPARDLATLHTRALYSPAPLPPDTGDRVATFWRSLELAGEPAKSD